METKFNFNSQICTTREQSERLLALGLKKETADMWYPHFAKTYPILLVDEVLTTDGIPAWSLHRLWELLGKIKKYEGEDELMYPSISIEEENVILINPKSIWVRQSFCSPKGVYENIINCIEKLIKEGYFNFIVFNQNKAVSEPYNHQTIDNTKKTNREILKDFCGEKKKEEGVDTKELLRFYNYYELKCDRWNGEFKVEELYKRWYDGRKKVN